MSMDVNNLTPHENANHAFQCNRCKNLAADPVSTKCGHLFCRSCIYSWSQSIGRIIFPCPKCGAPCVYQCMVPLYGRGVHPPMNSVARVVENNIVHNMSLRYAPRGTWRDPILEAIVNECNEERGDIQSCRAEFLAQHPDIRWKLIEDVLLSMHRQHKKNPQLANCRSRTDHLLLASIIESCILFEELRGVPYRSRHSVAMVFEVLDELDLERWESLQTKQ